jgi:tetratricopeptide (TPR) repeat protein
MRRSLSFLSLLLALATNAAAQTAGALLQAGDAAAAADHHVEAIAAYQGAIAQRPELRAELTAKLGRQYLWAGNTRRAVELLREYVAAHRGDCDVRADYALALSWNNELRTARDELERIQSECPERRQQARLREALVYRWMDRPSAAAALYWQVLSDGTDEERREARVGLGFVELAKDDNRSASTLFADELSRKPSPSAYEGYALGAVRRGDPLAAAETIQRAEAAHAVTNDLADVRRELELRNHAAIAPRMNAFHDADGTSYHGGELAGSIGWKSSGRAEAMFGRSSLERGGDRIDDRWAGASIEHRFAPSFALVANARRHAFDPIDFHPTTGELDLVVTPSDRTRIDAAAARILIADNIAALQQHLAGTFVSVGIDRRVTFLTTLSASADDTRWNTNNERQRIRFNVVHRFEGVPRVTLEWPSLYMRYDQGFAFNLFSPRRYVESGPAVNVYRRFARYWSAAAYLRVGVQEEEALGWKRLAIARLSVERDLHDVWAIGGMLSWSNSNLASSTGFRRTAASLNLTRRY